MVQSIYKFTACETVSRLRTGSVSIQDVLNAIEERGAAVDGQINALPTTCFERARQHADRLQSLPVEQRGPLYGLPVTIKDLTPVAGVRSTSGSRIYEHHIPDHSDRLVRLIEQRGGIVYAKSNTPEFGAGGITFNDIFGLTRSPRNTQFASGGSSGGAAASLAAGSAWLSHGSDMAGSLRTPASFCGVTSLRPSPGTILADSEFLPYDVLGADGPMARNIEDLGLFADIMINNSPVSMQNAAAMPVQPGRIAVSCDLGVARVSDEVRHAFQRFVDSLAEDGWNLVEASPDLTGVDEAFDVLRAQNYAVGLSQVLSANPGVMKPEVVWNIENGLSLDASRIRHALRSQGRIINTAADFMDCFDVLLCPATSVLSVAAELRYPGSDTGVPVSEYYRWLDIAYASTMTTLPVITLPVSLTDQGMPLGIQLIGKPKGEYCLFQHARQLEIFSGWSSAPIDPVNP